MKTRTGFVSNSSSSSYVILVKPGYVPTLEEINNIQFDLYEIDEESLELGYLDESEEKVTEKFLDKVKSMLKTLQKGGGFQQDDCCDFNIAMDVVMQLPGVLEIGGFDTGPDAGYVSGIMPDKVEKLKEFL